MTAWITYLVVVLMAWAFRFPALVALAVAAWVVRRSLPDPLVWWRHRAEMQALRARVEAYPADLVARRDLARLSLDLGRGRTAVRLLEEAIAKGLDEGEAYYLLGAARFASGDARGALAPLVRSVAKQERLRLGEPYFVAAKALCTLNRWDEAEDALERGLALHGSNVEGFVSLARVRVKRADVAGAHAAWRSAIETWHELPDFLRWKTFPWFVVAHWQRWWAP